MRSGELIVHAMAGAGVPCAFMEWPVGSAPELPWAVYLLDSDESLAADDRTYHPAWAWEVELYEAQADPELEQAVRDALESAFDTRVAVTYQGWLDDERCAETVFSFTEIVRED